MQIIYYHTLLYCQNQADILAKSVLLENFLYGEI